MDLGFALDVLYSAGWWPDSGAACPQSSDGRWYPDPGMVDAAFHRAGWHLHIEEPKPHTIRADWTGPGGVRGAAIASDPASAHLLALAALVRADRARPRRVDPAARLRTVPTSSETVGPIV